MHLHVNTVRQGKRVYRYARLVESYRRPSDGKPTTRVLANLGKLKELQIENLRTALRASARNRQVTVAPAGSLPEPAAERALPKVLANYRYLDIAVFRALWRHWDLPALLGELMSGSQADVPHTQVIEALVMQRCVAPNSKLAAARWLPTTALPELLGVLPAQLNNSRIHRALEAFEPKIAGLQDRLARIYQQCDGAFVSLFLDVTDTFFIGHGPPNAQKGQTKEGLYRRKLGIVLLCNESGYPLRWRVVAGNTADQPAMLGLLQELEDVPWLSETPLVCDRAMGQAATVAKMLAQKLRFVTAVPVDEIESYTDAVPKQAFSEVAVTGQTQRWEAELVQVRRAAAQAGLRKIGDAQYIRDLGVIRRGAYLNALDEQSQQPESAPVADGMAEPKLPRDNAPSSNAPPSARLSLKHTRILRQAIDAGQSYRAAGATLGYTKSQVDRRLPLLKLVPELQEAVLRGEAEGLSLLALRRVAKKNSAQEQRQEFERQCRLPAARSRRGACPSAPSPRRREAAAQARSEHPVDVRAVLHFNPEAFIEQRANAHERCAAVQAWVNALNEKLATATAPRRQVAERIAAQVAEHLRRKGMSTLYTVQVERLDPHDNSTPCQVHLYRDDEQWQRRRRHDGLLLLITHPKLELAAAEVARLYRAKDKVEKDFQTIKSTIELRPIHHREDHKVAAHVALCMLALLLQRTVEKRLDRASHEVRSAARLVEVLKTCHLNVVRQPADNNAVYTITQPTDQQAKLLRDIGLPDLIDEHHLTRNLTPR